MEKSVSYIPKRKELYTVAYYTRPKVWGLTKASPYSVG
jgi:hypothetical protein